MSVRAPPPQSWLTGPPPRQQRQRRLTTTLWRLHPSDSNNIPSPVAMSQASPIAERLSRYAYSPSQRPSRRRPRPLPVKEEVASSSDSEGSGDDYDGSPSESDAEAPRERVKKRRADGTVVSYGWPKNVKVAHPSKYEGYPELDDLLRPGLDGEFNLPATTDKQWCLLESSALNDEA